MAILLDGLKCGNGDGYGPVPSVQFWIAIPLSPRAGGSQAWTCSNVKKSRDK